ncbi:MAG: BamA/TamA family outer membrane protein [Mariprofundaceae bacterium]
MCTPLMLFVAFISWEALAGVDSNVIKAININGLERTGLNVVRRELPFAKGDSWQDNLAVVGERRLRNLGLFSEVHILRPDNEGIVHISVKERWTLWLLPEGSRSDIGKTTAGITLTEHNLWGLHHKLRLAVREDTGKNFTDLNGTSYQASYFWRRIADGPLSWTFSINKGESVFDAFENGILTSQYNLKQDSWSTSFIYGLGPVPGEGWDIGLGFSSSLSNFTLVKGLLLDSVQDSRRKGMHIFAAYQLIDDQITWLTGVSFSYSFGVAHRAFGSTMNVYRQQFDLRKHVLATGKSTFDMRLSGGAASGDVFLDGLYDIGGKNQLRGYFPGELQGTYYMFGSLEGRVPISKGGSFQLVGFTDIGQIWKNGQPALGSDVLVGSGIGLRWILRWLIKGTFRTDVAYGWATNRWRVHFGTGQAF